VGVTTDVAVTTADELFSLPDDGMRHELVAGEHRVMSPTGFRHGRVTATIGSLLFAYVREAGIGVVLGAETGFVLERDPDTVRAPDAAFVSRERAEAAGDIVTFWSGPPDFAAEVVSPSDTFTEVEEKALFWLQAGTKLVLVVDPARRTATTYSGPGEARTHREHDVLDLDVGVPGWRLTVSALFG
jgi:Uma2 family endonuclease